MIGAAICWLRGHNFRRARKSEDQSQKFCVRCGASVAVRHRKKETTQ